ncbi:hypothetical protein Pth03_70660 [Planotetraspora thailandica]|uniref:Ferric oxidoreductase domain-containing protein n=1 Tax=Planotetraspora thailandica TaxID=487172 RepID=A0A8J3Y0T0_9ACTN|nr:hypothetical protein [Planotetraspora thailandica]GII58677.1 hypothetical protein Pth03_70660 [Planotetraspora thailandica]
MARRASRRGTRILRAFLLCAALAAVLAGGSTERGALAVDRLRAFLEFYSGVFALVGLSAAVVAGLAASERFLPIRLRILAQAAHRAAAAMSMSFLASHVLLKVLQGHASVLDVAVPFEGGQSRALWIGLGTIASDMMIIVFATGVARGRFIGKGRPWTWRVLHIAAYLCWPVAVAHGLNAGRAAKDWVTMSYVACLTLVAVLAVARFLSWAHMRATTGRRGTRTPSRTAPDPLIPETSGVPDEQFWAELKAEAASWTGSSK